MTGRAELNQYRELALIGEAKVAIARGRLAEAELTRGQCDRAASEAEQKTGAAFEEWAASIGSAMLGPAMLQAAAGQLLAAERTLIGAQKELEAAAHQADEAARSFQSAEARARAERDRSQKLSRRHRSRADERGQEEIAELIQALRKDDR